MSYSFRWNNYAAPTAPTQGSLRNHWTSRKRALTNLKGVIAAGLQDNSDELPAIADTVFEHVTDSKILRAALDRVLADGGDSPGPDGVKPNALSNEEAWELCRGLSSCLRNGTYRPGPARTVTIPKASGRGLRTLSIQNVQDRIVGSALAQVLRPLVLTQLTAHRVAETGSRDELLARCSRLVPEGAYIDFVKNDIRDAFDRVPVGRLEQLLPRLIPSFRLMTLVNRVARKHTGQGIAQGSALSPLLLDIYLDHHLHHRWQDLHPECPLLRYADDMLILCEDPAEAQQCAVDLVRVLRDCGMPAKYTAEQAVGRFDASKCTTWLGMDLRLVNGELVITPSEEAWQQLEEKIAECHEHSGAMLACRELVAGWIAQLGPCTPHMEFSVVYERVKLICDKHGLRELVSQTRLQQQWNAAARRWQHNRSR